MASYFFRVEHDLLRSDAFRSLGGSAIKVYLVIGLFSDFGTDWGYPSTRTIARQSGLSRQTVIDADQRTDRRPGCWSPASRRADRPPTGCSARPPPSTDRPGPARQRKPGRPRRPTQPAQNSLEAAPETGPESLSWAALKPVQIL